MSLLYFHVSRGLIQNLSLNKLLTVNLLNCRHDLLKTARTQKNEIFHFKQKSVPVPYLITFTIYNKAQHIGGFLYIGTEMTISFNLECSVGMEFN